MPTTVNGIGTHYYGRKNLVQRPGTCPHCNRDTTLNSYDTRLWFVVVFIPIVPLGRKHIIDECGSCRRHYVADADKWEATKQLEISGSMDAFRSAPTPEAAMAAHQKLLNFHQLAEAAEFRSKATAQFPRHAQLQAYFGEALTHLGRAEDAPPYYARALELRPDLPEARVGTARAFIRANRLDEARALLEFLEKPGAGQLYNLAPVEELALAFQKAKRHDDALARFRVLLDELPGLHDHRSFRQKVVLSEKALGRTESHLRHAKFTWRHFLKGTDGNGRIRNWSFAGGAVVLVLLGFVIANEYIRQHRVLYIVNGLSAPAEIRIDGVGEFKGIRGRQAVPLAEGRYHAVVTAPVHEAFDFFVEADYFDRWGGDPAWVVNIGGAALLVQEQATYTLNGPPPNYAFRYGHPFESFATITHPFQELPETVSLKSGESRTLTGLKVFNGEPNGIFRHLADSGRKSEAMDLAEWYLARNPEARGIFGSYLTLADERGRTARIDAFLRRKLADRPVRIEWHRAHQQLHRSAGEHPALIAEYDQALAAAPSDSALLYLRGRIEVDPTTYVRFMDRARETDPKNPFPLYALAHRKTCEAEWADAAGLLGQAVALAPANESFAETLSAARLGMRDLAAIENESRQQLRREPLDGLAVFHLIEALALQDRGSEITRLCQDFSHALDKASGEAGRTHSREMQLIGLYAAGSFADLEARAKADGLKARAHRIAALIELGRPAEAAKLLPANASAGNAATFFSLALAFTHTGDTTAAGTHFARALDFLAGGDLAESLVGKRLRENRPLSLDEARALDLPPQLKAVLLAAVAQRQTESRTELQAFARRLSVAPLFPFHLINRTCPATE